ncbi:5-oxoprolinase subunit B family protein [Roseateles sp. BYS180W]|uniref:5-oxoprolinase subunit B family protein n=1 Tax=Roseateles rivi TaxID=3299028 RepID=UPI00374A7283
MLKPLSDLAWTLALEGPRDEAMHGRIMALTERARATQQQGLGPWALVCDVQGAFTSMSVFLRPEAAGTDAAERLGEELLSWVQQQATPHAPTPAQAARHWCLPACFELPDLSDLPEVAQACGLSQAEVVQRLCAQPLRVDLLGFLPGFPYMSGLPPELALPRRATPRARVPAQTIAITGTQCCVYPWESPGGWHLLGRTPLPLFDVHHPDGPAWLAAGDCVRWQPISAAQYQALAERLRTGPVHRQDFALPSAPIENR